MTDAPETDDARGETDAEDGEDTAEMEEGGPSGEYLFMLNDVDERAPDVQDMVNYAETVATSEHGEEERIKGENLEAGAREGLLALKFARFGDEIAEVSNRAIKIVRSDGTAAGDIDAFFVVAAGSSVDLCDIIPSGARVCQSSSARLKGPCIVIFEIKSSWKETAVKWSVKTSCWTIWLVAKGYLERVGSDIRPVRGRAVHVVLLFNGYDPADPPTPSEYTPAAASTDKFSPRTLNNVSVAGHSRDFILTREQEKFWTAPGVHYHAVWADYKRILVWSEDIEKKGETEASEQHLRELMDRFAGERHRTKAEVARLMKALKRKEGMKQEEQRSREEAELARKEEERKRKEEERKREKAERKSEEERLKRQEAEKKSGEERLKRQEAEKKREEAEKKSEQDRLKREELERALKDLQEQMKQLTAGTSEKPADASLAQFRADATKAKGDDKDYRTTFTVHPGQFAEDAPEILEPMARSETGAATEKRESVQSKGGDSVVANSAAQELSHAPAEKQSKVGGLRADPEPLFVFSASHEGPVEPQKEKPWTARLAERRAARATDEGGRARVLQASVEALKTAASRLMMVVAEARQDKQAASPRCTKCNAPAPLQCAKCKAVYYCSKSCQTAHWPTHKESCKKASSDLKQNAK